jgi:hypothetical protein
MTREILGTITLLVVIAGMFCITTNRRTLVKKLAVVFLLLSVAMWLTGCSMLQTKKQAIHKGYVCYTNATIVEVKNAREQLKFMGAATKPEKKKLCDVVLRTDQNEMMTASREGYIECSTKTVNARVTAYTFNNQVIGINESPDPYLEENNSSQ